ncbi:Transcriptional regulator KdgR [Sporomusa rhizae]|uniref:IclR family transcriptional regulator n=1 Tax=Sporomusa rhizae TaxID=357999 RepID=UPI00352AA940
MNSKNNTVNSVDKALAVLEALGRFGEIGISDLHRELGFGKGTIHRLITTLRVNGYVEQTETEKYRMSLKLFEMGSKVVNRLGIREVAKPYMEQLAMATKETINLGIVDCEEVMYLDRIESPEPLRMGLEVGTRVPIYCSGLGLAIISNYTPAEINNLLTSIVNKGRMTQCTENTVTDPEILKKRLQVFKEQGYSFEDEEIVIGLRCVAAPVFNFTGKVVAAVSIASPKVRLTDKALPEFVTLLKEVTKDISSRLGYNK